MTLGYARGTRSRDRACKSSARPGRGSLSERSGRIVGDSYRARKPFPCRPELLCTSDSKVGRLFWAKIGYYYPMPPAIGTRSPRPVNLLAAFGLAFLNTLAAQPPIVGKLVTVEGTISVEGAQLPTGYLRVVLDPVGSGNELSAEVRSNGTYTIGSVAPGHWRVSASGAFIKSVTRGEREYSAADVEIGDQAGPPFKIVASTNFASLRVTAPGEPRSTEGILFFFWIGGGPNGPCFRSSLITATG